MFITIVSIVLEVEKYHKETGDKFGFMEYRVLMGTWEVYLFFIKSNWRETRKKYQYKKRRTYGKKEH